VDYYLMLGLLVEEAYAACCAWQRTCEIEGIFGPSRYDEDVYRLYRLAKARLAVWVN